MSTRFDQYKIEYGADGATWKTTDDAMKDELNTLTDELEAKEEGGAAATVQNNIGAGLVPYSNLSDATAVVNGAIFYHNGALKFKDDTGTVFVINVTPE